MQMLLIKILRKKGETEETSNGTSDNLFLLLFQTLEVLKILEVLDTNIYLSMVAIPSIFLLFSLRNLLEHLVMLQVLVLSKRSF